MSDKTVTGEAHAEAERRGAEWQRSRDVAEVERLTAQLQAAQATIAAAKSAWFGPCQFDLTVDGPKVTDALASADTSTYYAALRAARARAWDECLNAIEKHELNTEQARAGNPYRAN